MLSKSFKKKVIAPILIIIILSTLAYTFFNFNNLFRFDNIEIVKYRDGCVEKYVNKVNVTPPCGIQLIINYTNYTKPKNNLTRLQIEYPIN